MIDTRTLSDRMSISKPTSSPPGACSMAFVTSSVVMSSISPSFDAGRTSPRRDRTYSRAEPMAAGSDGSARSANAGRNLLSAGSTPCPGAATTSGAFRVNGPGQRRRSSAREAAEALGSGGFSLPASLPSVAAFLPTLLAEDRKRAGWSVEQAARRLGGSQPTRRLPYAGRQRLKALG